jgi:hypothetical protein
MYWLSISAMKAVTLHQPWASLTAIGAMTIIPRPQATPYRGLLAIHASKKPITKDDPYYRSVLRSVGLTLETLPRGAVVATCRLIDCEKITETNTPCYPQYAFGNYVPGWYAWKLQDIGALSEPIQARGHGGLWIWNS